MTGFIHTDTNSRSSLLFNQKPSFNAETLELHSEPDKTTILHYTDDAFSKFHVTDLEVLDSGTVKGGYDKGFDIQPSSGYTVTIVLSGDTGDLGDIPATIVLDGTTNDRLSRNGNDGVYALTQGGETKTGGARSGVTTEIHYFQITSVVVQEEEEEEEETVTVVTQPASVGGLPMAAKIGIPVVILAVVVMAMKK